MFLEIVIYQTSSGKKPFESWLDKIKDRAVRGRILARLDRLRLGNFGDCSSVGDGLYELRFQFGAGYRVYYSKVKNTIIVLLYGGDKSSQKKDILTAKEYLEDYKNWENKKYGKK